METSCKLDSKKLVKWLVAIVIPALCLLIPVSEVFTAQMRLFVVITVFMMALIAMELVPILMSAIFLPALYILTNLAEASTALSAWTAPLPFMLIGAFVLALGLKECGLLDRIAYSILSKTGGGYKGIYIGIMIMCIVLGFLTSGNADAIIVAFVFGVCVALNLGSSKSSSGIMMVGAIACADLCLFIFKPNNMSVLIGNAQAALGEDFNISWGQFLLHNWPWAIGMILFILGMCKFWKPDIEMNGKDYFLAEHQKLGPMTAKEKKGLVIALIIIALLLTTKWTGLNSQWVLALVPWAMFLPGVEVATEKSIKEVKFPVVFFAVACMSIGGVAASLGIGNLVANLITPLMGSLSNNFVIAGAIFIFSTILNFLMTPLAMLGVGITPVCTTLQSLGLSSYLGCYAFYAGVETIFLPYESTAFLIFYAFGNVRLKDFVKIMSWKALFYLVWLVVIMVPYWMLIGIA